MDREVVVGLVGLVVYLIGLIGFGAVCATMPWWAGCLMGLPASLLILIGMGAIIHWAEEAS